ncbi:hypothetical protein J21TS3_48550 [Paenibacillus cookii]|uniref:Uncharacterized protein n=1 Tax=Paenibacillus cookii TaxID=157839 RepID=A0ABQ4M3J8_9BACL|nr:hypothetical protein J21TS3_48550 [Paenibacillus cookii]
MYAFFFYVNFHLLFVIPSDAQSMISDENRLMGFDSQTLQCPLEYFGIGLPNPFRFGDQNFPAISV